LDINKEAIDKVMSKKMPFYEIGAQDILDKVVDNGSFHCTAEVSKVADAENIIVVPGTPLDFDFVTDMSQINRVMDSLFPHLRKGQVLILRSTVAPNTTDYIKNLIGSKTSFVVGKDLFLSFAPERIVEGDGIREIAKLPQIIGVYDDETYKKVKKLFDVVSPETLQTTPLEAELAKLFTNNYRYVNFALANEFFIIANSLGANIFKVIKAVNHNYTRARIPAPGFTKGPCLGKDSWILLMGSPYLYSFNGILSSAFRVNEGIPFFILNGIKSRVDIHKAKIAVLGLTFKKDCDDVRDSLSMKFLKILKNEQLSFDTHDPFVCDSDLKKVLEDKNVVVIAVNHSVYENVDITRYVHKGTLIVDLWNTQRRDEVFFNT
jgi:UDP-N-acetyl-D-mannosaminuronic acid dehydrogenase